LEDRDLELWFSFPALAVVVVVDDEDEIAIEEWVDRLRLERR
jgi:hypothetical protein